MRLYIILILQHVRPKQCQHRSFEINSGKIKIQAKQISAVLVTHERLARLAHMRRIILELSGKAQNNSEVESA